MILATASAAGKILFNKHSQRAKSSSKEQRAKSKTEKEKEKEKNTKFV
jgi:hypothetical protein